MKVEMYNEQWERVYELQQFRITALERALEEVQKFVQHLAPCPMTKPPRYSRRMVCSCGLSRRFQAMLDVLAESRAERLAGSGRSEEE